MKISNLLPYAGMVFLLYLAFVNNIPGNSGPDESGCEEISQDKGDEDQYLGFVELNEFLDFMNKENNSILNYSQEEYLDTTGDGENELVRSSFRIENNVCLIEHEIVKNNVKIWEESFQIANGNLEFYFGNFELDESQKEKALSYLGLINSTFVEKIDISKESDYRKRKILDYHFRNSNLTFQQKINSTFYSYLTNYTGHYVFKRIGANAGIFMWDNVEKRFVEVYSAIEFV